MRLLIVFVSACLVFSACTRFKSREKSGRANDFASIVRLAETNSGRVASANSNFAVLTFPFGNVPANGQELNVYREGKKVGELRVTGPQRDINTVADIVSGEAKVNDEVRRD
jgi:hypothetical protein